MSNIRYLLPNHSQCDTLLTLQALRDPLTRPPLSTTSECGHGRACYAGEDKEMSRSSNSPLLYQIQTCRPLPLPRAALVLLESRSDDCQHSLLVGSLLYANVPYHFRSRYETEGFEPYLHLLRPRNPRVPLSAQDASLDETIVKRSSDQHAHTSQVTEPEILLVGCT